MNVALKSSIKKINTLEGVASPVPDRRSSLRPESLKVIQPMTIQREAKTPINVDFIDSTGKNSNRLKPEDLGSLEKPAIEKSPKVNFQPIPQQSATVKFAETVNSKAMRKPTKIQLNLDKLKTTTNRTERKETWLQSDDTETKEKAKKEEERKIILEKVKDRVRLDLQNKYASNSASQRTSKRIQSLSASLSRKYHNIVEARKAKQQIDIEYQKLKRLEDDDSVCADKVKKESKPMQKQNSSPPAASREDKSALEFSRSKTSSPDVLDQHSRENGPSERQQSVHLVTYTTDNEDYKRENPEAAMSTWIDKALQKSSQNKNKFDKSPKINLRNKTGMNSNLRESSTDLSGHHEPRELASSCRIEDYIDLHQSGLRSRVKSNGNFSKTQRNLKPQKQSNRQTPSL